MEKTALVIGASGGIGAAITSELHKAGFSVIMTARSETKLKAVAEKIGIEKPHIVTTDLSNKQSIEDLFLTLKNDSKTPISTIVVAAGGWMATTTSDSLETVQESFETMLERNFTGPALALYAGAHYLKEHGGGRLINISSHAATKQLPGNLAYGPAKAAVRQFALSLDDEIGLEVDISDIQPAVVNTESMTEQLGDKADRAIQPNNIGKLIVLLAQLDHGTKVHEVTLDAEYEF